MDASVAGNAMLGAVLAVFSRQLLLEKQINMISYLKVSFDSTPVKTEAEMSTEIENKVMTLSVVEGKYEVRWSMVRGEMRFE